MPTLPQQQGNQWQPAGEDAPLAQSPAASSAWEAAGGDEPLQAAAPPSRPAGLPEGTALPGLPGPEKPQVKQDLLTNTIYGDGSAQGTPQQVNRGIGLVEHEDALAGTEPGMGLVHAAAKVGQGIKEVYTPTAAESRARGMGIEHGMSDPSTQGAPMTPAETAAANRQATVGVAHVVEGGGTLLLVADAPALLGMGQAAVGGAGVSIAEKVAARVGLAKVAAYMAGGTAASVGVGAAADKLQLAPETKELLQAGAFFVPSVIGAGLARAGFEGGAGLTPEGKFGAAVKTPGGTVMGVHGVDGGVEGAIRRPGDPFPTTVRVGRQPQSPPTPGQISAGEVEAAAAKTVTEAAAVSQAAENMVAGNPPPKPPGPPNPPGMDNGVLTPKVVADVASLIKSAPPEMQAQAALEAHGKLADWMFKTGKFVGPDGKLQIADTPQKAAALAQQVLNDEVDRHAQMEEDQQKQQEEAAKVAQKEQEKQAKEQEKQAKEDAKAAETPNENGLTPAEVMQARAKTIIESSESPEQASATIMRNLRVTRDTAQQLIAQHQQQQVIGQGTDVGSGAEPTKEESRATVDAQLSALAKGNINVVMLPDGSRYMPQLPPGMKMISVTGDAPGAGKYIYNPTVIRAATIKEAAKAGTHGDLLGHIQTKEEIAEGPTVVVQAHTPEGVPIQDSQVHADPALVQAQAEALHERHPEAHISVKSPEQVLQERAQATQEDAGWEVAGEDVGHEVNSEMEGGRGQSPEQPETAGRSEASLSVAGDDKDIFTVHAHDARGINVGSVTVGAHVSEPQSWVVTDSGVEREHRGTGLGQRAYDEAIAEVSRRGGTKLYSDNALSPDGVKAWERLSKRYPVKRIVGGGLEQDSGESRDRFEMDIPKTESAEAKGAVLSDGRAVNATEKRSAESIPGHDGKETTVLLPEDKKLPGRYRLVEHADLQPSHIGTERNPNVTKGVQERNYDTDKEARARVIENEAKYEAAYTVNTNPDAINGPPVIFPDGEVIGGNGRTETLRLLHANGRGNLYTDHLRNHAEEFGFTAEQVDAMRMPVLVREVEKPATTDAMRRMGSAMNKPVTQALSPAAAAVSAGKSIKPDTLARIGDMLTAAGGDEPATLRELMANGPDGRKLLKMLGEDGALTSQQRGAFIDKASGGLSEEGKTFIQRAIMGNILDDVRLMEATPKQIIARLEGALGGLAVVASRDDSWNLLPVIRSAVGDHMTIAKSGNSIEGHLAQTDMFATRNPLVDAVVRVLGQKGSVVRDGFKSFAADSQLDVPGQATMLMQQVEPSDAFNHAFKTDFTPDQYYDGLMSAAAEDPYERQKEQEGTFRRQRTRGLSSRKPRDESGGGAAEVGGRGENKPGERAGADAVSTGKGARVTVRDRDGVERTGTVAYAGDLVTRVKTDDGSELTVKPRDVKPEADFDKPTTREAAKAAAKLEGWKVEKTGDSGHYRWRATAPNGRIIGAFHITDSDAWTAVERARMSEKPLATAPAEAQNTESAAAKPARDDSNPDTAGAGRPSTVAEGGDRGSLDEVPAGVREGSEGERNVPAAGGRDGAIVRETPGEVSGERPKPGPRTGSDSVLDNASRGQLAPNQHWFTHPDEWTAPPGTMGKLDANMDALRILRDIEKNPRLATPEEQTKLSRFVGWGALPNVFAPWRVGDMQQRRRYQAAFDELSKLLSESELKDASKSTLNAHYTSPQVVRWMWSLAERMGFKGGNVLEPSMGVGNFFGMMPQDLRAEVTALGNELEPVTAGIAKLLYPGASVFNKDFVELVLPNDSLDLAISNVPFGGVIYDPQRPKLHAQIHDYFFVKTMDKLRPGGVLAFVTSTGTMDKVDSHIRDVLASKADLVGAVRLPSGAFAANAGTSVTTDLIVLRKRFPGEAPNGPSWAKTMETRVPGRQGEMFKANLNEYFHERPEMMLGTPVANEMNGRQGGFALAEHKDQEIGDLLDKASAKFPKNILSTANHASGSELASTAAAVAKGDLQEGQFVVQDGKLRQYVDGELRVPEAILEKDGKPGVVKMQRAKAMVGLRDSLNDLLQSMLELPNDEQGNSVIRKKQDGLLRDYQRFTKANGFLNAIPNRIFEDDPHYPRLMALENYDRVTKSGTPADIFTKRTIFPREALTTVSHDPKEALYQVLAERGFPDVDLIAKLQGTTAKDVAAALQKDGLVYRDPESGNYLTRERYLSGYVRDKLALAKRAVEQGQKEYQANVDALEKVQPEIVPIKDINVKLGATWIPIPALQQFIKDTFKVRADVKISNVAGKWTVQGSGFSSPEARAEFGTPRMDAFEIMQDSLNQKEVQVTDPAEEGDGRVINKRETLIARERQKKIRKAFNDWAATSDDWAQQLERTYNQLFNGIVLPDYDGSHLTLPGANPEIKLRPHQKNVVWRILNEGRALMAHDVGAGKTYAMIATAMEGKRVGLWRKPMLAVPNHIVGQFQKEFLELYPGAKLLVPSEKDFESGNRKRLMARIATGDFDAVILGHSQFNQLDVSPERQQITINRSLRELRQALTAMLAAKEDKRTVKQMEKALDAKEQELKKLSDLKADNTIYFDHTGVDQLFIDEAHEYKNLDFSTKMTRIAGLSQGDAKKATRLKMKTEFLQDNQNGRGVVFATGTPVQNTMAEQFNMTKYVAPDVFEKAGIHFFDDWAANFGIVETKNETSPDGQSIKARTKFSKFTNVPELMALFRSFTDIQTAKMLNLPVPEVEGGGPQGQYIEPSPELQDYVLKLMHRAAHMPSDPREDNMLKVVGDGRKAALDMRLVHPNIKYDPDSKIGRVFQDVLDRWKASRDEKLTQMVFIDQYRALSHRADGTEYERLNLYNDLRDRWIAAGIPTAEIAVMGEHDTKEKKQALFAKVNSGQVRILLGSTAKMGAGTNAQRKLKHLHDVDLPWRPGDLAQRHGRIVRQGNSNKSVGISMWLTKRSFDTYMLQALETKARFIEQLFSGKFKGREIEDLDSSVSMSLQDMKVAVSGNPDLKLKYDLEQELEQLESLEQGHDSQRRSNLGSARQALISAGRLDGQAEAMTKALKKYQEAKGPKGDGFSMSLDGTNYTDHETAFKHLEASLMPMYNFHMTMNGINIAVRTFSDSGQPIFEYSFEWDGQEHTPPDRTLLSLGRSIESRLRNLPDDTETVRDTSVEARARAAKYEKLAQAEFPQIARIEELNKEIAAVEKRLGLKGGDDEDTQQIAEDGDGGDEEPPKPVKKPSSGPGGLRSSLFGVDVAGEAAIKALKSLYTQDVAPALAKVAEGGTAAGKQLVRIVAPRAVANLDGLDAMMKLKGDLELKATQLEYAMRGIKTMFDKMTEEQRIEFIDRYKTGQKQELPELQEVADTYRAADTAMHHEVVEAQIGDMDATVQRFWRNLDGPNKSMFWNKVEAGEMIARDGDEERAKRGDGDASIRLRLQAIADSTLTFKQNHLRVFWKTLPSPKDMLGFGVTKSPPPAGAKRPLAGDKGFLKQATLKDISEGIERGGVPVSTNPQKLFELGQMSSLRFITAKKMRQAMSAIGLRKYVKPGETPPQDWVKVDDPGDKVQFRADSGEGFVKAGDYYYEPSVARLINNYLSRDLMRETAIGKGLILFKNLSTAIELSLSPYHLAAMSLQASASQVGLGIQMAWNQGIKDGSLDALLKGAGLVGTSVAAPVTMARTGGSAVKYMQDAKAFIASGRGVKFLNTFGDEAGVAQMIIDAFHGGLTLHMPREYRADTMQSMREAWSSGNPLGAILRSPFAAATVALKPLFEHYIPRLKMGMFLMQYAQELEENHEALLNGDMTRLELARKVVDMVENRFGELNFSNIFWDNTFKTALQTVFRSVTWKLGTVRGAATAIGPEMKAAFADPLEAFRNAREGKEWKAGDAVPKMGRNQAGLLGLMLVLTAAGAVLAKVVSGKYPWEYLEKDEEHGMSAAGALALETMHPRTGSDNPYSKLPVRMTFPTDFRDFEHMARDPKDYVRSSLSGTVGSAIDSMENRDFFGNYVYDPNGSEFQKMAQLFAYNAPQPISVKNFREGRKTGDMASFKLGLVGMSKASSDFDLSPAEKRMRDLRRAAHSPMTPAQVDQMDAKHSGERIAPATHAEIKAAIRAGKLDYAEKMFKGMSYADARDVYMNYASPKEQAILRPMLLAKGKNLLRTDPARYSQEVAPK